MFIHHLTVCLVLTIPAANVSRHRLNSAPAIAHAASQWKHAQHAAVTAAITCPRTILLASSQPPIGMRP
jgi:hypothetical protein